MSVVLRFSFCLCRPVPSLFPLAFSFISMFAFLSFLLFLILMRIFWRAGLPILVSALVLIALCIAWPNHLAVFAWVSLP